MRIVIRAVGILAVAIAFYVTGIAMGLYGRHLGPGTATSSPVPDEFIDSLRRRQLEDAGALGVLVRTLRGAQR